VELDPIKIIEIFRQLADTKTAWVIGITIVGGTAWRARGWKESLATKAELKHHKKTMYEQSLVLEGNVQGSMQRQENLLKEHTIDDEKRFETMDTKIVPQFVVMDQKIEKSRRSLARIEGALKIDVPEEDK
jgi:hypothetical protein